MQHAVQLRLVWGLLLATPLATAGEFALLKTGYHLHIERHEVADGRIRLFTEDGGSMELPEAAVLSFEPDDAEPDRAEADRAEPDRAEISSGTGAEARSEPASLDESIERFAAEVDLPPALIHAVISAESNYQADAVSHKGAIGLMQLMPETAAELQVDPHNPTENVKGGVTYLKQMLELYAGREDQVVRALAAYNAGPHRVEQYDGVPPYAETRAYVRRVIRRFLKLSR